MHAAIAAVARDIVVPSLAAVFLGELHSKFLIQRMARGIIRRHGNARWLSVTNETINGLVHMMQDRMFVLILDASVYVFAIDVIINMIMMLALMAEIDIHVMAMYLGMMVHLALMASVFAVGVIP